jgi:diguanylate cyclase (GGDEF)-like protein
MTAVTPEQRAVPASVEDDQVRQVTRTVTEIHWLVLTLVLLYLIYGGLEEGTDPVVGGAILYAAFFMGMRYTRFHKRESRARIAIETWGMIAFITWVLWFTGGLASPLVSAYLLAVITSALTLGKLTTFFEVALIAACFVFLGGGASLEQLTSLAFVRVFAVQIAPVLVVAYVTTMFSGDMQYGLNRAQALSETDPLTGLLNMRGFAVSTGRLFALELQYARPASVLMIDSDNLKTVNDGHGHEAGNQLLKTLARTIQLELRQADVPARYGGDEFIAFLPDTPSAGALRVAERIRTAVAGMSISAGGSSFGTSVSIGLASFPGDGQSIEALTAHADRAMYQAKRQGRNQVVRFQAE